jgi:hypothetical protein
MLLAFVAVAAFAAGVLAGTYTKIVKTIEGLAVSAELLVAHLEGKTPPAVPKP